MPKFRKVGAVRATDTKEIVVSVLNDINIAVGRKIVVTDEETGQPKELFVKGTLILTPENTRKLIGVLEEALVPFMV